MSRAREATSVGYVPGFRNHVTTEALPGALPEGQNSPQRCPYGLYAEQISGTAFTAPRGANLRTWTYRIRPSVVHGRFREYLQPRLVTAPFPNTAQPNQMRWDPVPEPDRPTDFIDGLVTLCGNGSAAEMSGIAAHVYVVTESQTDRFCYDADGELLVVPQSGELVIATELGTLELSPGSVGVIPRGVKFQVRLGVGVDLARGYVCENYGAPFELPPLGPIGANGLANPRDFETPVAAYEAREAPLTLCVKLGGRLWTAEIGHSPLDVVAWHGNYAPYRYDLGRFNVVNTVSFDHPDPSIFTVLTSPSAVAGTANCDFVIFPPRWMVAENTFRPPWFHRNVMSEFMGLVHGVYDAKAQGFVPGGASLHNCMSPHGPDATTFERASTLELSPRYLADTLAFMFESRHLFHPTQAALDGNFRQPDYQDVWQGLGSRFDPAAR